MNEPDYLDQMLDTPSEDVPPTKPGEAAPAWRGMMLVSKAVNKEHFETRVLVDQALLKAKLCPVFFVIEDEDTGERIFDNAEEFQNLMGIDHLPTEDEAERWLSRERSKIVLRYRDRLLAAIALGPTDNRRTK